MKDPDFKWAILDLKGVVSHAFHASMTPEPIQGDVKPKINTATFGFTTFLKMYYDEVLKVVDAPMNIIACLDDGNVYRKSLLPEYKSGREKKKATEDPIEREQLAKCLELVKKLLVAQGAFLVRLPNQEADDIIAYLAKGLKGSKVIYTKDQDILALAGLPDTFVMYQNALTTSMKGVPPNLITLFKSIVGDTSDGYIGVKGLGESAWTKMVDAFGLDGMEQIDGMIANSDLKALKEAVKHNAIKPFIKCVDEYSTWNLMYKVAKLAPEICVTPKNLLEWVKRAPTIERLTSVLAEAGCRDLVGKYEGFCYRATLVTQGNLRACLAEIKQLLPETPIVPWDYETTDKVKNPNYVAACNGRDFVSMLDSSVTGCSFAFGTNLNHVFYFSVDHKGTDNVSQDEVLSMILDIERRDKPMCAQNVNFEATITRNVFGHELKSWFDTKLFAHHIDENTENGLKALSKSYLNYSQASYTDTLAGAEQENLLGLLSAGNKTPLEFLPEQAKDRDFWYERFRHDLEEAFNDIAAEETGAAEWTAFTDSKWEEYSSRVASRVLEVHGETNIPCWVQDFLKPMKLKGASPGQLESTLPALLAGDDVSKSLKTLSKQESYSAVNSVLKTLYARLNPNQEATIADASVSVMADITGEQVLNYGCDDSLVTGHLFQYFAILSQLEETYDFVSQYECAATAPLMYAHIDGVKIDRVEMEKQKAKDEATVATKMAAVRATLNEHCTEPRLDAVEALLADQRDYITFKAKNEHVKKMSDTSSEAVQSAVKSALSKFKSNFLQLSFYQEPKVVKHFKPFIPTPKMFNDVAALLGLGPIATLSKVNISNWVEDNPSELAKILAPVPAAEMKARAGDTYQALEDFCNEVIEVNTPSVMEGTELNFGSPQQMQALLYLLLELPIRVRTEPDKKSLRYKNGFEGSPSTDESAMQFALANDCEEHPWKAQVLKDLLDYRGANTRLSNYWTPYPLWMDENDKIHPGFNSCGTITRRPTGSNPNTLQVSKGDVRKVYIPDDEDHVICSVDFASQELRILANECKDPVLMSAYPADGNPLDLHALTGTGLTVLFCQRLGMEIAELTLDGPKRAEYNWFKAHQDDDTPLGKFIKTCRAYGKTANFGVANTIGAQKTSMQLMINLEDAELILKAMDETYPGIQKWKSALYKQARIDGYVKTAFGSRRHCGRKLSQGSRSEISRMERQLSNFMMQGTAADLLKVVFATMHKRGTLKKHGARLIAAIYDELLFHVPKKSLHAFLQDICDDMEQDIPGAAIPMVADCSFGPSWGKQYEVGNRPSLETVNAALEKF